MHHFTHMRNLLDLGRVSSAIIIIVKQQPSRVVKYNQLWTFISKSSQEMHNPHTLHSSQLHLNSVAVLTVSIHACTPGIVHEYYWKC